MKVNKKELLGVLEKAKSSLGNKELELESCFVFTGEEIISYRSNSSSIVPFKTDFSCAVVGKEFYSICSTIKSNELDIVLSNNKITIKGDREKACLNIFPYDDSINVLKDSVLSMLDKKDLPDNFSEGISFCSKICSKIDETILFYMKIQNNEIFSTDNCRLTRFTLNKNMEDSFLFPAIMANIISKFNFIQYLIKEEWLYLFDSSGFIFSCCLGEGDFPDCSVFLDYEGGIKVNLINKFKDMIGFSAILADNEFENKSKVEIDISNKKVVFRGKKGSGWTEIQDDIDDDIELKFNIIVDFVPSNISNFSEMIVKNNLLFLIDKNKVYLFPIENMEK